MSDVLKKAAAIANPFATTELPVLSENEAAAIADILLRNNVSILGVAARYGGVLEPDPLRRALAQERVRFDTQREEFERIRRDFEEHGIRTMLFKSTGLAPSFPHLSSNLDVLVSPGSGDRGRQRLHALGYIELLNVEEPAKYLFRRFLGDGACFTFHLHEQVGWGVPFLNTDTVWSHATTAPDDVDVTIPGPEEALLVTLAHWFYEDKTLSLQNLFLTADAIRKLPDGIESAAAHAHDRGWGDGFYAALAVFDESWRRLFAESGLPAGLRERVDLRLRAAGALSSRVLAGIRYGGDTSASVPFLLNKLIYYQKVLGDRRRSFAQRTGDCWKTFMWALRWKLHIRSHKPLLIVISGCDGSGKTVQVERLQRVFDTCDLRTKTVWTRGASSRGIGVLIRTAKRAFAGASGDAVGGRETAQASAGQDHRGRSVEVARAHGRSSEAEKNVERRAWLKTPMRRVLFATAYALDLAWVYAVKVPSYLLTGTVVICDRYVDDAQVDFAVMADAPVGDVPFPLRALRAISPVPHAAFVLDVDEKEALARKPEEGDTRHLLQAREAFKVLARTHGGTVVPASLSIEEVHERIAHSSLATFYPRYGTMISWMLASNPAQLNPGRWRADESMTERA